MSEDVNARLQGIEASLNDVKLRASTLVEDARRAVDTELESEVWDVSEQVNLLASDIQAYLEDAFQGRNVTLESLARDTELIIDSVWSVLGTQFLSLLSEIETHVYAALDVSRREIQGLVDEVAGMLDLVLIASNNAIDNAVTVVEEDNTGLFDDIMNAIDGLVGENTGIVEGLIGLASGIVDPLAEILDTVADKMIEGLTGVLTIEPEDLVTFQRQVQQAMIKQAQGS